MGHTHTDIALYMHRFMYRYCTTVRNLKRWTVFLCTELWTAVQLNTTYTHLRCTHCAWISCTAVHLYFSPFSVHSWTVLLCIQLYCTTVHSLVPAWPLFCQPIIKELGFTCFALIGPLSISPTTPKLWSVDTALLPCRTGCVKNSSTSSVHEKCLTFQFTFMYCDRLCQVLHINPASKLCQCDGYYNICACSVCRD